MLLFALLVFASLFRAVLAQGSPSDYAPTTNLSCPNITFVRSDGNISAQEVAYINSRQANVLSGWNSWIGNGSQIGYNFSSFQGSNNSSGLPKVGIAVSGGGYRAAQC
jgi:lysophospholipase